jgi:multisubunit Na+/H+ antiporter MnhF subunit
MSNLVAEKADELYISWIINWDIHSITTNILNIFNANIFYPYHNSLAYSDIYITSAFISFLPSKIIGEPAVAFNFIFIFSLITLGFFTYLLTNYLTKNHLASVVSGTLVSFSSYTLTKYMHIQLLNIGWVPLSIIFFIKFLDQKKYKYLMISAVFFIVQLYNSFLPGYFIVFSCLFIFIYYLLKKEIKFKSINLLKVFLIAFLTIVAVLPVIIPYYRVSKQFSYQRDIRDSIQFANRLEYTLYPGNTTRLSSFLLNTFYKNDNGPFTYDGFVGAMFFTLGVLAIIYRIKNRRKKLLLFDIFIAIGVFGFILSLGPAFQWGGHVIKKPFLIPLPYAAFYYLIPGFNGMRNSARWEMLFLFSFSVAIGIFLSSYFSQIKKTTAFFLTCIICLLIFLEFNFPYRYYSIPTKENFPKVYYFINSLPKDSVISEFPIYNWGTFPEFNSENTREYYSTLGFWKTFNGGAGFTPLPWQKKATFLIKNFPGAESINLLKNNGVDYIVLHAWEFDELHNSKNYVGSNIVLSGLDVKTTLDQDLSLELIYSREDDYVYKIK